MMHLSILFQIPLRVGLAFAAAFYFARVLTPKRGVASVLWPTGLFLSAFALLYTLRPELYYLSSNAAPVLSACIAFAEAGAVTVLLFGLTRDGWARILLFYALSVLISVLSSLAPFAVMGLFGGRSIAGLVASQWNDLLLSLVNAVLHMTLLIAAAELIGRYLDKQAAELRWSQFAPVIVAQAVSLVLCTALVESAIPERERLIAVLSILLLIYGLVDAVQISSLRAMVKNSELKREIEALRDYQKLQQNYYLSLAEQLQAARRLRHDYKNTLLTMDALIGSGEVVRAKKLAAESSELLLANGPGFYTGNDILDAVLNSKAAEAEKAEIRFSLELTLPQPLRIADVDLMSLFCNLLDNAMEYEQTLESADRSIEIRGSVRAGLWALSFSNTYGGETLPQFQTTKKDKTAHGHGREIVRTILQRYDGALTDQLHDGVYTVLVTLNAG